MQIFFAFVIPVSGNKISVSRIDTLADISFRILLPLPATSRSRQGKCKGNVHPTTSHKVPQGEKMYSSTLSLTSVQDVVGRPLHAPAALPRERTCVHCTGGWVGPMSGLDRCGKSRRHRDSIPGPSSP